MKKTIFLCLAYLKQTFAQSIVLKQERSIAFKMGKPATNTIHAYSHFALLFISNLNSQIFRSPHWSKSSNYFTLNYVWCLSGFANATDFFPPIRGNWLQRIGREWIYSISIEYQKSIDPFRKLYNLINFPF